MRSVTKNLSNRSRTALGALCGLLAGYAALAVAELVSATVRPEAGPVVAVGATAIDRTPATLKEWAIRHFGTDDKIVLQLGILAVLAVLAMALGVLAVRFRRAGAAGVLVFGVVGALAATGRPDSRGAVDALPSAFGAVVAAVLLYWLAGRLSAHRPDRSADAGGGGWDRRGFVRAAAAAAAASTGAGLLGRTLNTSSGRGAVTSRGAVVLPRPASPAAPVPKAAFLQLPGLSPLFTPNADFYRVDTALVVPKVDATTWRLKVHGEGVTHPRTITFDDLLRGRAGELIERDVTLACVSNEVGGPYVGNARWIGVRLADLLTSCGVRPPSQGGPADQLVARSVDGMTIGSPVEAVLDGRDAMLAVGMNGRPLPFAHGFPVRMVVPGLYGYVSACKWIEDIELTTFAAYDAYWVKRSWAQQAPVKTQSRIDTPKPFARSGRGTVMVAGVAWAQHRGISRVEVRVDDGPWQQAQLAAEDTVDTWRLWSFAWQATSSGTHTLTVRATDGTGTPQTEQSTPTVPDGATGWHSVVVTVG
ncbi:molybdopterin-dependent oxidoreductase [Streptomyces sp. NPDC094438]|uniref:molybdopterin-dependent oxidoreductase n=1 Tax=Streptomyces sp. NPDC094438 TaxID=3366061 RepID=UPI00381CAAC5